MTALIIIVAVLFLIALIPIGIRAEYSDKVLSVTLNAAFIKIHIIPKEQAAKHKKKERLQKKAVSEKKDGEKKDKPDIIGLAEEVFPIISDTLGRLKRKLVIDELTFHYLSASPDPYDAAMNYGRVSSASQVIIPFVDNWFNLKKREISTDVSFNGEGNDVYVNVKLSLRVWKIIYIAIGLLPILNTSLVKKQGGKAEKNGETSGK